MGFLKGTRDDVLTLQADDGPKLRWYIDAAFSVHPCFKIHNGAIFALGKGAIMSISMNQKFNSWSPTKAELNGVDDKIAKKFWNTKILR